MKSLNEEIQMIFEFQFQEKQSITIQYKEKVQYQTTPKCSFKLHTLLIGEEEVFKEGIELII